MAISQDLEASLYFLSRHPLYKSQKPYILKYASENLPVSNYITEKVENVPIRDLRGIEDEFTFSKHGFAILNLESTLDYDGFQDESTILDVYFKEVADALLSYTQGASIHFFDFLVSTAAVTVKQRRLSLA